MRTVLIVCHANVSRSVMAEAILSRMLESRGLSGEIEVVSAGVAYYARDGSLASLDARLALEEIGIKIDKNTASTDLKQHRELAARADLILAMTAEQVEMLRAGFPTAGGKATHTLKEYAGGRGDIDDPQGQDESVFVACRKEIQDSLERCIDRLIEDLLGPAPSP